MRNLNYHHPTNILWKCYSKMVFKFYTKRIIMLRGEFTWSLCMVQKSIYVRHWQTWKNVFWGLCDYYFYWKSKWFEKSQYVPRPYVADSNLLYKFAPVDNRIFITHFKLITFFEDVLLFPDFASEAHISWAIACSFCFPFCSF